MTDNFFWWLKICLNKIYPLPSSSSLSLLLSLSLSPSLSLSLSLSLSIFQFKCALLAWQKLYICIAKAIAAGLLTSSAHLN